MAHERTRVGSSGPAGRRPSPLKRPLPITVLEAAERRIKRVFNDFPVVYVAFSGGKDSGVLLEMACAEARRRRRRVTVLIVDLEAQYQHTIDYLHEMLARHADVLDVYWVCLPLNLRNAVSMFQPYWTCWDPQVRNSWVRDLPDHPGVIADPGHFDFFTPGMEFEDFVVQFGTWLSRRHRGRMTACLVAIRTDESLNRFRTIASQRKRKHQGLHWTTMVDQTLVNAYPLYDWHVEDIWRYYGRFRVPNNRIYDLMHQAGVTMHQARLCQPYGDDQRKGLHLFALLEPKTWGKVVARVQGANFGARYSRETGSILGRITITKPADLTWKQYAELLLDDLPSEAAEHYRDRIARFLHWYSDRGYPDDIPDDGPLDKKHPSWRRVCKMILTYDYIGKSLSFAPPASQESYTRYKARVRKLREEGIWSAQI